MIAVSYKEQQSALCSVAASATTEEGDPSHEILYQLKTFGKEKEHSLQKTIVSSI